MVEERARCPPGNEAKALSLTILITENPVPGMVTRQLNLLVMNFVVIFEISECVALVQE